MVTWGVATHLLIVCVFQKWKVFDVFAQLWQTYVDVQKIEKVVCQHILKGKNSKQYHFEGLVSGPSLVTKMASLAQIIVVQLCFSGVLKTTNLMVRFWTKMMLAYFESDFRQFLFAKVSVVCVCVCFGLIAFSHNVVEMVFESSEKVGFKNDTLETRWKCLFSKTLKHYKNRGFKRFGALSPWRHNIPPKRAINRKFEFRKKKQTIFSQNFTMIFLVQLWIFLMLCWNA